MYVSCLRVRRYPGTTFMDHVMRYQKNDDVKMIVVLGEVGGTEEYKIIQVRAASGHVRTITRTLSL